MKAEPDVKRTVVFVDGQNLFHAVRESFGYSYPNYDIVALSKRICSEQSWFLNQVRFYTGIPESKFNTHWHHFWMKKLAVMGRQGVVLYTRPLRYRNRIVILPEGSKFKYLSGEEKGIDVRIAIDIIRMAHHEQYDVALIFSQDQDLSEVAEEIRAIAREQH